MGRVGSRPERLDAGDEAAGARGHALHAQLELLLVAGVGGQLAGPPADVGHDGQRRGHARAGLDEHLRAEVVEPRTLQPGAVEPEFEVGQQHLELVDHAQRCRGAAGEADRDDVGNVVAALRHRGDEVGHLDDAGRHVLPPDRDRVDVRGQVLDDARQRLQPLEDVVTATGVRVGERRDLLADDWPRLTRQQQDLGDGLQPGVTQVA